LYQALYRKWRPRTFDDVIGQNHITDILLTQVKTGRLSHAYLFTGTRGTGKTTCARILSRAVNCLEPRNGSPCNACPSCLGIENGSITDIVEIDAASNNGVDNVRDLREEAIFTPAFVRMRVYIIDEVHMLSPSAFNALLKLLEEPPRHVLFILATTEVHKAPATILSRCQRFAFRRIMPDDISKALLRIAAAEGIALSEEASQILAGLSDGAMRDAISLLDQCAAPGGEVGADRVKEVVGLAGYETAAEILGHAARRDASAALALFDRLWSAGAEVSAVMDELSVLCRDLLILNITKNSGPRSASLLNPGRAAELAGAFGRERLLEMLTVIREYQSRSRYSTDRRVDAELCLMRMCFGSQNDLLGRIGRIEELLKGGRTALPDCSDNGPPRTAAEEKTAGKTAEAQKNTGPGDAERPVGIVRPGDTESDAENARTKQAQPQGSGGNGSFDWSAVAEKVKDSIAFADYQSLVNPALTAAKLSQGTLTVFAANNFVEMRLKDRKLQSILKEAAGASDIVIAAGLPQGGEDRLDKLLSLKGRFDNITVE